MPPQCLTREPFFGRACLRSPVSRKLGKHRSIKIHQFSPPRHSTNKTKAIREGFYRLHVLQRAHCCLSYAHQTRAALSALGLPLRPEAAHGRPRQQGDSICLSTELPSSLRMILIILCCYLPVLFIQFCCLGLHEKYGQTTKQTDKQK